MEIRSAGLADSAALLEIYGAYLDTPITFECQRPTEAEFAGRIAGICGEYPYLVCLEEGRIAGYAYAHRQGERAAYQWSAELSIYLDRARTARGLGKRLYGALLDILRLQGVRTVYGRVTMPNERSEGLHRSLGFRRLGTYRNTGYKCGAWRDVACFEKAIAPYDRDPEPFRPIRDIPAEAVAAILAHYGRERP